MTDSSIVCYHQKVVPLRVTAILRTTMSEEYSSFEEETDVDETLINHIVENYMLREDSGVNENDLVQARECLTRFTSHLLHCQGELGRHPSYNSYLLAACLAEDLLAAKLAWDANSNAGGDADLCILITQGVLEDSKVAAEVMGWVEDAFTVTTTLRSAILDREKLDWMMQHLKQGVKDEIDWVQLFTSNKDRPILSRWMVETGKVEPVPHSTEAFLSAIGGDETLARWIYSLGHVTLDTDCMGYCLENACQSSLSLARWFYETVGVADDVVDYMFVHLAGNSNTAVEILQWLAGLGVSSYREALLDCAVKSGNPVNLEWLCSTGMVSEYYDEAVERIFLNNEHYSKETYPRSLLVLFRHGASEDMVHRSPRGIELLLKVGCLTEKRYKSARMDGRDE